MRGKSYLTAALALLALSEAAARAAPAAQEFKIRSRPEPPMPRMTDGRVRLGKGDKRRLKKERGW